MAGLSNPNRATLRKRLRSALTHKALADLLLDRTNELQTKFNATLAKLAVDADHPAVAEVTRVTATGTGTSLDTTTAKYWTLHDGANAAHYVYYQVSDGANFPQADPAPGGTGHLVTVLAADTAAQIATKTRAVVDPLAGFIMPAPVGAVMTVTNAVAGPATDATAGTSGFTVLVTTQGSATVSAIDTNFVATQTIAAANIINPDAISSEQSKTSYRKIFQSALSHRALADTLMNALVTLQNTHNALLVKLDAQSGTLTSTNFAATLAVTQLHDTDAVSPAQDKTGMRTALRAALANGSLADQLLNSILGLQTSMNSALAALDAHNTLTMASLEVSVMNPESTL